MAVTKTHPIRSTLNLAIEYTLNPEKTDNKLLCSSYSCGIKTAVIEFEWTRKKTPEHGTHLARHLIQSFSPGETTPEQAHEIGKQLADEVLGGKYEYVISTQVACDDTQRTPCIITSYLVRPMRHVKSVAGLTGEAGEIMSCMTYAPNEGIRPRLFAKWLNLPNLNTLNLLIEYGFIRQNGLHKITLHSLIKEITVDDMKPSISNYKILIDEIHKSCLYHSIDTMFKRVENIILLADKDDTDKYLLFLNYVFAYMEKYAYRMELIISELERMT